MMIDLVNTVMGTFVVYVMIMEYMFCLKSRKICCS